jgi:hypothetical protein
MTEDRLPAGYVELVEKMHQAAVQWTREHPFAEPLRFTDLEQRIAAQVNKPSSEVFMGGAPLSAVIDQWAANEDTRALLRHLVAVTEDQATFQQARFLIDYAKEEMLRRGSGRLPAEGWVCLGCHEVQKSFTNLNGSPEVPPAGSLSVCMKCATLLQVNDAGNGYAAVSTSEFNTFPKAIRKALRAMQATAKKWAAEEQNRD